MKNLRENYKLHFLKTKFIYLSFLFIGLVAVMLSFYYENGDTLELSFGLLSGAVVSLVTSFTIAPSRDAGEDRGDNVSTLIDLLNDVNEAANTPKGVCVYPDAKDNGLDIGELINGAKERVYVLGTDMSNFTIRYGDKLVDVCKANPSLSVRILSAHPKNLFCLTRFGEIGWDSETAMSNSVEEACFTLKQIKKKILAANKDAKFDIRLYFSQPTVQMILVDNRLIISHFISGSHSSETVHLSCDLNQCRGIANDFEAQHFESVWAEAVDIEAAPDLDSSLPHCSLSADAKVIEYGISERKGGSSVALRKFKKLFGGIRAMLRKHMPSLAAPIIFTAVAIGVLTFFYSPSFDSSEKYETLNNCLKNMSLGFISGSFLSSVEYFMQLKLDRIEEDKAARELDESTVLLCSKFNRTLGENHREYGVEYCESRNDADIKIRILAAKKRVWIYATNHKYISTINVKSYLYDSDMDVRFLMLSPKSLFVSTRFHEIPGKTSARDFSTEISNNLQHLIKEYKGSRSVKLRLFFEQPTFMMYLIDDTLIVSHILRQGRARDQVHFIFDLRFPDIKKDTSDFIEHFLKVWERAEKCDHDSSLPIGEESFVTYKGNIIGEAVPAATPVAEVEAAEGDR